MAATTDLDKTDRRNGRAPTPHVRYAIVGAGFGGLGAAVRLERDLGEGDFLIFERQPEVGGCWWANQYPGAQCDIPSHLYSLSFAPNPEWSRAFAPQPEIRDYLIKISHDFGLRDRIRLETTVEQAHWDEERALWALSTSEGDYTASYLIAAPGPLSEPTFPEIEGFGDFGGEIMHTAAWRHDVDLEGKRVAVVGTGASAIQAVPQIAKKAAHVTVFQRTAPWIVPHTDRPIPGVERALLKRLPVLMKLQRAVAYGYRETLIPGFVYEPALQRGIELIADAHRRSQVSDRELRERLKPAYRIGCKRVLPTNRWYPALQRDNVTLVSSEATLMTENAIAGTDGTVHDVDVIVFATGFHVTDIPIAEQVHGVGGRSLAEVWDGSPQAYKGVTVPGFPNLFFLVGPNTGLGSNSIVYMIESQLNYVIGAVEASGRGEQTLEVTAEACERFNERLQRKMARTVWATGGCASWYIDAKGRVTTLWPDFTFRYRAQTRRFDADAYVMRPVPAEVAV